MCVCVCERERERLVTGSVAVFETRFIFNQISLDVFWLATLYDR